MKALRVLMPRWRHLELYDMKILTLRLAYLALHARY